MPDITNTTQQDPMVHLVGTLGAPERYITDMEASGQRELVNSGTLPADADWAELEALGFVKGDPVNGDPLFVNVTLPLGWSKQGSDHSMGSYVVDDRGVRRVSVFYKAAFYDRRASMHLIDPGSNLATEAIYGEGDPKLPTEWGVLTDAERDAFRCSVQRYLSDAAAHPDIYGGRLPRVDALKSLAGEAE